MKNVFFISMLTGAVTLGAFTARAQCTKDIECKGERICRDGRCVDLPSPPEPQPAPVVVYPQTAPAPAAQPWPAPAPAAQPWPAPAPAPAATAPAPTPSPSQLQWFEHAYGLVSFAPVFHGWGGGDLEDSSGEYPNEAFKTDSGFWGGVYIGAYLVPSEKFHIGAFWSFNSGDFDAKSERTSEYLLQLKMPVNNLGLSARAGGRVAERAWIGGALDLSLMIAKGKMKGDNAVTEPMFGLSLYPRLVLDLMLLNAGSFKMAVNLGFGVVVAPTYGGHPLDNASCGNLGNVKLTGWMVGPAMLLGLSLGG